jgi:hypothetical protein
MSYLKGVARSIGSIGLMMQLLTICLHSNNNPRTVPNPDRRTSSATYTNPVPSIIEWHKKFYSTGKKTVNISNRSPEERCLLDGEVNQQFSKCLWLPNNSSDRRSYDFLPLPLRSSRQARYRLLNMLLQ